MGEFENTNHNMDGEENAAFWLPSHFLTDDDFLSPQQPPPKPNENDDEFFAELTRQLALSSLQDPASEKGWKFSTSPQSTLSGFGQWSNGPSQVPSPPLTPPGTKNDAAAWDLLYEAAGQVARLKLAAAQLNRGLLSAPTARTTHHHQHSHNHTLYHQYELVKRQQQQQQQQQMRERGALGLPQSAWPTLRGSGGGSGNVQERESNFHCRNPHHQHHHSRTHHHHPPRQQGVSPAVFLGTTAVKRQSTGTGVFIPRKIGGPQSPPPPQLEPPRKKPTGCSTVLLPTRVIQTLNMDMEEMNSGINHRSYLNECELLLARRNAILAQQRRAATATARSLVGGQGHIHGHGLGRNQELCLPNDWTY